MVTRVDYFDPVVTLGGQAWGLGTLCFWKLLRDGDVVMDPEELDVDEAVEHELVMDALWELVGQSIVSVEQSELNPNDPIFLMTSGYTLQLRADSDIDPWNMDVEGQYFVGSMT